MIYTIGEALIDFIPDRKGIGLKDVGSFLKAPGGAPANVACAVAKLGGQSAFIGKLGQDAFGEFLTETLTHCGVDTSRIVYTRQANTSLAFVSLKADGNRDFSFYRNPGADMLLEAGEIAEEWFHEEDFLHFGSVELIESPAKYAHIKAIELMRAKGGTISFDPNVRLPLWDSPESCRRTILEFIPRADILKISDEELSFITGIEDEREAIQSLFTGEVKVIVYTRGKKGAELYTRDFQVAAPGLKVEVVDTTGAGDAFVGAFLYMLSKERTALKDLDREKARQAIFFANRVAAVTTTRKGAIESLPNLEEISLISFEW
ncbi:MAG: carbohydrate kinase [Clostridia bacterium]|nr:carbohydrate kinase [Clostridia bacterium]